MKELAKVFLAVALAEIALWGLGVWSWTSYGLRRWPWLLERYTPIFLVALVVMVLVLRRWRWVRLRLGVAGVAGAFGGLTASMVALLLAQVLTAEDRTRLLSSLDAGGVLSFAFVELSFVFLLALAWLHGAAAATFAIGMDRLERHFKNAKERAAGSSL